MFEDI